MCGVCRGVWGVRGGVRECALVSAGVCGCERVCGCARVRASVRKCASVCAGVGRSAWVCTGMHWCAQVCVDMHRCAYVCGMNFQNFFWRIESLHQRTLIRILYEFFLLHFTTTLWPQFTHAIYDP